MKKLTRAHLRLVLATKWHSSPGPSAMAHGRKKQQEISPPHGCGTLLNQNPGPVFPLIYVTRPFIIYPMQIQLTLTQRRLLKQAQDTRKTKDIANFTKGARGRSFFQNLAIEKPYHFQVTVPRIKSVPRIANAFLPFYAILFFSP